MDIQVELRELQEEQEAEVGALHAEVRTLAAERAALQEALATLPTVLPAPLPAAALPAPPPPDGRCSWCEATREKLAAAREEAAAARKEAAAAREDAAAAREEAAAAREEASAAREEAAAARVRLAEAEAEAAERANDCAALAGETEKLIERASEAEGLRGLAERLVQDMERGARAIRRLGQENVRLAEYVRHLQASAGTILHDPQPTTLPVVRAQAFEHATKEGLEIAEAEIVCLRAEKQELLSLLSRASRDRSELLSAIGRAPSARNTPSLSRATSASAGDSPRSPAGSPNPTEWAREEPRSRPPVLPLPPRETGSIGPEDVAPHAGLDLATVLAQLREQKSKVAELAGLFSADCCTRRAPKC